MPCFPFSAHYIHLVALWKFGVRRPHHHGQINSISFCQVLILFCSMNSIFFSQHLRQHLQTTSHVNFVLLCYLTDTTATIKVCPFHHLHHLRYAIVLLATQAIHEMLQFASYFRSMCCNFCSYYVLRTH